MSPSTSKISTPSSSEKRSSLSTPLLPRGVPSAGGAILGELGPTTFGPFHETVILTGAFWLADLSFSRKSGSFFTASMILSCASCC